MTSKQNGVTTAVVQNSETTPLISKNADIAEKKSIIQPIHRILLCGFLVSLSFSVTQVPLLYVFRLMTCDAFYDEHPGHPHGRDRCSIPEVEAGTARAFGLLGASTTFFGVANLFITGREIKHYGVKTSLALQVFWPSVRLLVQNIGVVVGGSRGIIIVQCSQIITLLGGPAGYLLALNTFVTEVTDSKARTGYLGILQGCTMFGAAIGLLAGGLLADAFSIRTPFQVTLALFLLSTAYVLIFLPWIKPAGEAKANKIAKSGLLRAFGPLGTLAPAKWILRDGRVQRNYGPIILAAGVFLSVLATGYIPTLLQMYATDTFEFGPTKNSYLVSSHALLRGAFLALAFPRMITLGRYYMQTPRPGRPAPPQRQGSISGSVTANAEGSIAQAMDTEPESDVMSPDLNDGEETYEFDLIFTKYSVLIDGVITGAAAFVKEGWQMYLIGAILPLGAGTSSSAKGTILQMCPASERTDALSAISLVEMIARLTTTFFFGLIFAAFASMGKTYLVFFCNAGVALLGFFLLLFSRFPPAGSKRLELSNEDVDDEDS